MPIESRTNTKPFFHRFTFNVDRTTHHTEYLKFAHVTLLHWADAHITSPNARARSGEALASINMAANNMSWWTTSLGSILSDAACEARLDRLEQLLSEIANHDAEKAKTMQALGYDPGNSRTDPRSFAGKIARFGSGFAIYVVLTTPHDFPPCTVYVDLHGEERIEMD